MNGTITDVPGIKVGHAADAEGLTGCTVVLCEGGAVGGVDQRGGAPGTRETDLLRPMHLVRDVHAVVLAGGSAFGLAAADGVMRYLAERNIGLDVGVARVPIVPAAILFDLAVGRPTARPDAAMGYAACLAATEGPVLQGNAGAGMGCSVGKALGAGRATKAGIGSASLDLGDGLLIGVVIAVNAFGEVVDESGHILAGARLPGDMGWAHTLEVLRSSEGRDGLSAVGATVIGIVATNAPLDKEQANKVAQMAQDGLARAICPAHTMLDGDTIFVLATSGKDPRGARAPGAMRRESESATLVGAHAAEAVTEAIRRAVRAARTAGGLPSINELMF
jgi:L-aminopeptidase/D-esterase-like protein